VEDGSDSQNSQSVFSYEQLKAKSGSHLSGVDLKRREVSLFLHVTELFNMLILSSVCNIWNSQGRYMSHDYTINSMLCCDVNMFFLFFFSVFRLICQTKSLKLYLQWQKKHSISYQDGSKTCWKENLICSSHSDIRWVTHAAYAHPEYIFLELSWNAVIYWIVWLFLVYTILGFLCITLWFWPIMEVVVVSVEIDL
jgi:hypothetical protein